MCSKLGHVLILVPCILNDIMGGPRCGVELILELWTESALSVCKHEWGLSLTSVSPLCIWGYIRFGKLRKEQGVRVCSYCVAPLVLVDQY